ncbi:MAG: hypothetical protein U0610_11355 [bacterium]
MTRARLVEVLGGTLARLIHDDDAQTSIEYALICGIVAVAAISSLERIRADIVDIFAAVQNALASAPVGDAG